MLSVTRSGVSRREWLRMSGLAPFAAAIPALGSPPPSSFGRAKACIVLFMFGAPAHQDTFDLKPEAPREVRGEFQPVATSVPGIQIVEHLPQLAVHADKLAQIRSVTHPDNTHTVAMHAMLTGMRHARPATNPQNAPDDFPTYGAVVTHLRTRGKLKTRSDIPASAVSLNAPANQVSANNHIFPGFFAGFLGAGNDPLFVSQNANAQNFQPLPMVPPTVRLSDRQNLLVSLEQVQHLERSRLVDAVVSDYSQAFSLLTSPHVRKAFDLSGEPEMVRQRYGQTPFGQGCLLARRLVQHGVPLVTVNWERDDAYWDTHAHNFRDLKAKLLPNLDRGFSALLEDLSERGMLDDTLIVWLGEFGRTPQINGNAGRDHWAACNTVVFAGAGVRGGTVHGASDRIAAWPSHDPVTPQDLSATIYHLLGIEPHQVIHDATGRPWPLSTGELVRAIL